jgi:hypothetical protein
MAALCAYGPCPEHRYSYTNVLQANRRWATGWQGDAPDFETGPADGDPPDLEGGPADGDAPDLEDGPADEGDPCAEDGVARDPGEELAPRGTETPGAWADFVTEEVATADASPAEAAWADAPRGGD